MDLDTATTRREPQSYVERAHPPCGVDALAAPFSGTTPIPGPLDVTAP